MSPTLQTLLPVAAGIAVVIVGILVFKLHAFLALLLAAAVTAAMTPQDLLWRNELERRSVLRRSAPNGREMITLDVKEAASLAVYSSTSRFGDPPIAWLERTRRGNATSLVVDDWPAINIPLELAGFELSKPEFKVTPHHLVVTARENAEARQYARRSVPARLATAFGDTVGSIGFLIAFAAVIGMCLLDSGGADRIVRSALNVVGERGAPLAFAGCGFLLGVPVFFDTVFLLMIPLGKAMHLRTTRNYILYVLTIVCGATMAHSLVPPTPGPLLVAEALDVEVGLMMFVGGIVGLFAAGYGILHAIVINRWITVPLRDTPEMPLKELEALAAKPDHELPPLWLSLLPIVLPVWLIAQQTALDMILTNPPAWLAGSTQPIPQYVVTAVNLLGEKNTAIGIGMVIALFLLVWQTRQSLGTLRDRVGTALASGGVIILITAAGGAFGDMLEQTGVAALLKQMPTLSPAALLSVAFLVTTAIRTAQGSATVAMITAVGLFAGIELPFHAVWLAVAIGCGSKPISWMTDSGFWVICKMSGMTETETLKTLTPMTAMMGVVGLVVVIVGATLFPMS